MSTRSLGSCSVGADIVGSSTSGIAVAAAEAFAAVERITLVEVTVVVGSNRVRLLETLVCYYNSVRRIKDALERLDSSI